LLVRYRGGRGSGVLELRRELLVSFVAAAVATGGGVSVTSDEEGGGGRCSTSGHTVGHALETLTDTGGSQREVVGHRTWSRQRASSRAIGRRVRARRADRTPPQRVGLPTEDEHRAGSRGRARVAMQTDKKFGSMAHPIRWGEEMQSDGFVS